MTMVSQALPLPDIHGWYVFTVGQEIRCPGPPKRQGNASHCGKYMGTVEYGQVRIRPEMWRRGINERREYPRYVKRCHSRDGCGAQLEVEMMAAENAA